MHALSGNLATMANGLPYAIAAQIAYPNRQVVAFVGGGGRRPGISDAASIPRQGWP
jgi:pyruvate dehydrogenase (quinone)